MKISNRLKTKCHICKREFSALPGDFHKETAVFDDGETLSLTWVICPHCGLEYVVALDNDRTEALQEQVCSLASKMFKHERRYNKAPTKLLDRYHRLDHKLDKMRADLIDKYNMSFYLSADTKERKELYVTSRR